MHTKPLWSLLLIDPSPISSSSIKGNLNYYGYTVHHEIRGRNSVQYVQKHLRRVDLIILDASVGDVPIASLVEVFNKLNPNIPIVLLSDTSKTSSISQLPKGVIGVLKRPIRTDRLLAIIAKALGRR